MAVEVLALIGSSGTGKSHRAAWVVAEEEVSALIDDGLLIHDGKILAGTSAKAESHKLAAVRRAVFSEPSHAREVREALSRLAPRRVLVLGTSRSMVERIRLALDLPPLTRVIRIEEVQSREEMEIARRLRRQGRHVVPVPTLEVRQRFSGYLVDPVRFFVKRREAPGFLVEKSVIRPTWSYLGRFTIAESAIRSLVRAATREVAGVGQVRRIDLSSGEAGLEIRLEIVAHLGPHLPTVMEMVQRRVREMVEYSTSLHVLGVHVTVTGLLADGQRDKP